MPILLILFIGALVELAVLVAVGKAIGVLATIGLLILASVVGAALLRREGLRTLTAFNDAVRHRRLPHRELLDGVLIVAAGVLIVLPGFVSDVLGLLLLLPPTRALVRSQMVRLAPSVPGVNLAGGTVLGAPVFGTRGDAEPPRSRRGGSGDAVDGDVIDGEVVGEVIEEPPGHRPPGHPGPGQH